MIAGDALGVFVKEAQRLVDLETEILERIQNTEGLLQPDHDGGARQSLDQASVTRILSVLAGEKHKLTNMDMVIAVIGTMKAGKSTTINAIVGSEVLPNRNAAMTALPTLIRHEAGRKEPRLSLQNPQPIREIIEYAQVTLTADHSEELWTRIKAEGDDLEELGLTIQGGLDISESYEGRPAIFRFLWWINDLIRLCEVMEIEFPFNEYDDVNQLPVISVEFAHLKTQSQSQGRLTLLDTPGPNEAGQKHLRHMIADQLDKASAVITVLNYTQLKTQADQDLRDQLVGIGDVAQGRIFALVNRYDEKGRNDPDEEGVRTLVADNLLKGVLDREHVFAVSARDAYLANSALKSLDEYNKLPNPEKVGWVQEFGELALGKRWERRTEDSEEVRESANDVWLDSGFGRALEEVIVSANRNAPFYALDSAASKLARYAESISNFINGRAQALCKETAELEEHVTALQKDVESIEKLRSNNEAAANELLKETQDSIDEVLKKLGSDVLGKTNKFFNTGKAERRAKLQQKSDQLKASSSAERAKLQEEYLGDVRKKTISGFLSGSSPMKSENTNQQEQIMDPDERELKFKSRDEAEDFVERLEEGFRPILVEGQKEAESYMHGAVVEFQSRVNSGMASQSKELLDSIMARFGKSGFQIRFSIPDMGNFASATATSKALKKGIHQSKEERKRLREQSGVGGSIKRKAGKFLSLFGSKPDWGYDEVSEEIDVFRVHLDSLQKLAKALIKEERGKWVETFETEVENPIRERLREFFDELNEKVSAVRSDLLQGIEDQRREKAERDALAEVLQHLDQRAQEMADDSEWLNQKSKQSFEQAQSDV